MNSKTTKITQLTVNELYHACKQAIANGNGDKYLITPNDNEGNGFHGVFFAISPIEESYRDYIAADINDSQVMDPSRLMILG